jgi:ATP-binding protein involved in chromosome partitioning
VTDPRLAIIDDRFQDVNRIIAVSSGKGGVGKSMVATCLALNLKARGYSVGLLDLDFTSPSTHVILGAKNLYPKEEYGIVPPVTQGLKYMSIVYYSVDEPAPLRGEDVSNAIIELLSITRWSELDFLIIDMPPGIGDATLDTIRLIKRIEFLVVTTPSKVAFQSVRRMILLLKDLAIPILGVLENMVMKEDNYVKDELIKLNVEFLRALHYDDELEQAIGYPDRLSDTTFYCEVGALTTMLG